MEARDVLKRPVITEKSSKKKRMGRYQGYTNKRRKAIVTLKEGSIDLFN